MEFEQYVNGNIFAYSIVAFRLLWLIPSGCVAAIIPLYIFSVHSLFGSISMREMNANEAEVVSLTIFSSEGREASWEREKIACAGMGKSTVDQTLELSTAFIGS